MTALFYFLQSLNPEVKAKKILKPYRGLFKSIGRVRDLHIAENLIMELKASKRDLTRLRSSERSLYRIFKKQILEMGVVNIRVPTVSALGITDEEILKNRKPYTDSLLSMVKVLEKRMTQDAWHKRRIWLKRYHHTHDAFQYCKGQAISEEELKKIRMLEQLLGDWHDRVIAFDLVKTFSFDDEEAILKELGGQERSLLAATKIYHRKFAM